MGTWHLHGPQQLFFLSLHHGILRPHWLKSTYPSTTTDRYMMEGIISIYLEALVLFIFFMGEPGVPVTAQFSPDDVAESASSSQAIEAHDDEPDFTDPVSNTHNSSPPPIQAHSGGLGITALNNRARNTSPPLLPVGNHGNSPNVADPGPGALSALSSSSESLGFPSDRGARSSYSSPHNAIHGGGLNIVEPITITRSSSLLQNADSHAIPMTGTSTHTVSGAQEFVMNVNIQDSDIVIQGEENNPS